MLVIFVVNSPNMKIFNDCNDGNGNDDDDGDYS